MAKALARLWKISSAVGVFTGFFVGGFLVAVMITPWVLLSREGTLEGRARKCIIKGYSLYLRLLAALDLIVVHLDPGTYKGTPAVIVANHPSILDIVPLTARLGPICIVVGDRSARGLFFALLWKLCGYVVVHDNTLAEAERVMAECVTRVRGGEALLIFPEGTRSPSHGLLPFSRMPFDIAARAEVPIIPVSIRLSDPVLNKETSFLRWPDRLVHYEIQCHAPVLVPPGRVAAQQVRDETRKLLAEQAEVRQLSAPETGTPLGAFHGT